jgi:hypothetical protein
MKIKLVEDLLRLFHHVPTVGNGSFISALALGCRLFVRILIS